VLYSEKLSSPNCPVNCLVSALFLLHRYNWNYKELMNQIEFNLEIRVALGLKNLDDLPFCERTMFNFKKRLAKHNQSTGENLLEKVFDRLTAQQLKELKVKTSIQRADSVLLNTNISNYSRLSLLVEILGRVHTILSESDQQLHLVLFSPYVKGGEKYVYEIKGEQKQTHYESLAKTYYSVYNLLHTSYGSHPVFQMFERTYKEHFKEASCQDKVADNFPLIIRPKEELNGSTISSPDDTQATCRNKRGEAHIGFAAFGAETCHPDNAKILADVLDQMVELSPDLEELHHDGGFGSEDVDKKADKHQIILIQTAIKGTGPDLPISIEGTEKDGFTVNCPNPDHPAVKARKLHTNYRADFDLNKCKDCPFFDQCPTKKERKYRKNIAILRFKLPEVLRQKRHKAIQGIPKQRRSLRSGVENLMARLRRGEKHTGKLKIRGHFNFELYLFAMGSIINFERIFRAMASKLNFYWPFFHSHTRWIISCQRTCYHAIVILLFI